MTTPSALGFARVRGLRVALAAVASACACALGGALAAEPAAAGSCANASAKPGQIGQNEARDAVVCLINSRRSAKGKGKVNVDSGLQKAASRHTRRMTKRNCFSHQCPGEKDLGARVESTSYLPCGCSWGVGENIAWGKGKKGTPKRTVKGWMNSGGHRDVLLDGDFEHVGVGAKWGSPMGSGKGGTYTATFGFKRG